MGKYTLKRWISAITFLVAFMVCELFISTAQAIRCYNCPPRVPGQAMDFANELPKCTGDNLGELQDCEAHLKDPVCGAVKVSNPKLNFTMLSCWGKAEVPEGVECGVTKSYNASFTQYFGATDVCTCNTDGCIPHSQSHSNWVHTPWNLLIPINIAMIIVVKLNLE